ncbi:MAG TPA: hypothetical protein VMI54_23550, partial [Polyangiaceae bacterium]|nr:hypothetical protein [Polyangiaceae bacterium]
MSDRDPLDDLPWPKPVAPSDSVSQKIKQGCTKGLDSRACRSARRRAALSMLFPTVTVGLFAWRAIARGTSEGVVRAGLYGALAWSIVLSFTLLIGLASPPGRRPRVALRVGIAAFVPLIFLLYLRNTAWGIESFSDFSQGAHAAHAVRCGVICFVVGAIMSGGVMLLWRRSDPLTPGISGAFLGLVGGMGSALGMGIACPSHEGWHVCVSHGVVVASLVVL